MDGILKENSTGIFWGERDSSWRGQSSRLSRCLKKGNATKRVNDLVQFLFSLLYKYYWVFFFFFFFPFEMGSAPVTKYLRKPVRRFLSYPSIKIEHKKERRWAQMASRLSFDFHQWNIFFLNCYTPVRLFLFALLLFPYSRHISIDKRVATNSRSPIRREET